MLVIILVPGAREIGLVVLGVTLPVHAALLLVVIHWGLRRAGTGWRALGFTRPTLHILHLLWQIPVVFVALILLALGLKTLENFQASGRVPRLMPRTVSKP
ncbi:hypothetical protein [Paramicrobacterium fandaimingii]|uniref:hypothetical protein n=1 Tax=Paramicrobacterium fandaimingii TaxID=2708079 RepID=UPI00141DE04C|nr:hypothetical protein [Microbacterium fandaimingii]